MDNSKYFYLSGFISLSLFGSVLFLFLSLMFHNSKIDTSALHKKNYLSISLVTLPKKMKKKFIQKISSSRVSSQEKVLQKNIDINNLFSDVWTKKIVHKKRIQADNKNLNAIQKKISKANINESNIVDINKSLINDISKTKNKTQESSAEEVNEYLAKIHALVYENFNVPSNSEGYSVKALIVLNALGQLIDFRVLTYSGNEALNHEADNIKQKLKTVVFPLHPENKATNTIVILTSQKE